MPCCFEVFVGLPDGWKLNRWCPPGKSMVIEVFSEDGSMVIYHVFCLRNKASIFTPEVKGKSMLAYRPNNIEVIGDVLLEPVAVVTAESPHEFDYRASVGATLMRGRIIYRE